MMDSSLFLLFLSISLANIVAPGAGVVMAITTSLEKGLRGSLACRAGLALGVGFMMTLSVSGLGVIVAKSPVVFTVLRFIGVAYLIYLGIRAWRAPAVSLVADSRITPHAGLKQFFEAVWLQITNPQPLVFFVSILPQCIDQNAPYIPQVAMMTVIYTALVFTVMTCYSFLASRAREFFRSPQAALILRRTSGSVFFLIAAIVIWTMIRN